MPQMTGFEVCRSILQLARGIQVVVMTASIQAINVLDAYQAGASDYVAKPVNTEQLLSLLRMWLHR